MGNTIVIPSMGTWFIDPLRKMGIRVKRVLESSTFFLTLDCYDESDQPLIVKAYEFNKPLRGLPIVESSMAYFEQLKARVLPTDPICAYNSIHIVDRFAFLVRPKFEYTLAQRLFDYPPLEDVEKLWIAYQVTYSLQTLHELELVHGCIHPDNIFTSWCLRVFIGDEAPFKPAYVRLDRPHVFIHFFGSSSHTYCYLSPQRILFKGNNEVEDLEFSDLSAADDVFSCGCVIYYIYTGSHLFTLSTLADYIQDKFDLEGKLEAIPENIRGFVRDLLNKDPSARMEAFKNTRSVFPTYFRQLYQQTSEFFQNDMPFANFVTMIPAFQTITNDADIDIRLIFANIFSHFLIKANDAQSIIQFAYFFVDYSSHLPDELILTRILPNIVGLLEKDSFILRATILKCLLQLLKSVQQLPESLVGIFSTYLIPTIVRYNKLSSPGYRCAVAHIAPLMLKEIHRLSPDSSQEMLKVISFIFKEKDARVLRSLIQAFNMLTGCPYDLFETLYPMLLSCFNSENTEFKLDLLRLFRLFYEQAKNEEKCKYRRPLSQFVDASMHFMTSDMADGFLIFFNWYIKSGLIDQTYLPEIYNFLLPLLDSTEPKVRFLAVQLSKILPDEFNDVFLPSFVLKRMNGLKNELDEPQVAVYSKPHFEGSAKLIKKTNVSMRPRFQSGTRVSRYPIAGISPVKPGIVAISDASGVIYTQENGEKTEKRFNTKGQASSMIMCKGDGRTYFDSVDTFSAIDWEKMEIITTNIKKQAKVLDMKPILGPKIFYALFDDSSVGFVDIRSSDAVRKLSFNKMKALSMCSWPNNHTIAVGFNEGFVQLFDIRMFTPISVLQTITPKYLSPIARGKCSLVVGDPTIANCYSIDSRKPDFALNVAPSSIIPYKGMVLALDEHHVHLLDGASPNLSLTLFDHRDKLNYMTIDRRQIPELIPSRVAGKSLHNHAATISNVMELESSFVSTDVIGNVHYWSIEAPTQQ